MTGLMCGKQLDIRYAELLSCLKDSFHGEVLGPVWPDEDSHSPWTDFLGPRQELWG